MNAPGAAADEADHTDGWVRIDFATERMRLQSGIAQDLTLHTVFGPSDKLRWSSWYRLEFCLPMANTLDKSEDCGFAGVAIHSMSDGTAYGNFDFAMTKVRAVDANQGSECDPAKGVCWRSVTVRQGGRYRIAVNPDPVGGDGWWTASLTDLDSGSRIDIGSLQTASVPAADLRKLWSTSGYDGDPLACDAVPVVDTLMGGVVSATTRARFLKASAGTCGAAAVYATDSPQSAYLVLFGGTSPASRSSTYRVKASLFTNATTGIAERKSVIVQAVAPPKLLTARVVGNRLLITGRLDTVRNATRAFLLSQALGVTKPIEGRVTGNVVVYTIPMNADWFGRRMQLQTYASDAQTTSVMLSTSVVVPKAIPVPTPIPSKSTAPAGPRQTSCAKGSQLRTFLGEHCPPGWTER